MKLEDMILVIENQKGTESKYLANFTDFLQVLQSAYADSFKEYAKAVEELFATKKQGMAWSETYLAANKTCFARFCENEAQLRGFLLGRFPKEEEEVIRLDEGQCSMECLEILGAYGIKPDGQSLFQNFHYEKEKIVFHAGETIKNLNGSDYQILEVLSPRNLLLMQKNTKEILVGIGVQFYQRTPKAGAFSQDSIVHGIEWEQGRYLGKQFTEIPWEDIRSSYGIPEEKETLEQYHNRKKQEFGFYQSLAGSRRVSEHLKKAAKECINREFGTDDRDRFLHFLGKGYYDGCFHGIQEKKENKSR